MRGAWRAWLFALLCVVIAVCIAALSARFAFTTDWSAGARATITPQSQSLLKQLAGPLSVTAYARPGPLRARASLLLRRYQRFKHGIALRFVDPDLDPAAVQAAGVTADGELVLHWKGRSQRVTRLDERGFSDALVKLVRGGPKLVAFITGDGERSATGSNAADLGSFAKHLAAQGARVVPLNLAEAAEVPRNADLVVLASPEAALLPTSVQKLADYVANGGNLLWLTESGSADLGLAPLAQALGLKQLSGTIADTQNGGTPQLLVTSAYPAQAITRGFDSNALFPQAAPLAVVPGGGWDAQPILQSSARSFNASAAAPAGFDPATGELRGPLTFGYALSRLSPSPARNQQRVVVIGGGAFLSNAYLDDAGNLALGERIADWLLGDDALISAAHPAPDTQVTPTPAELGVVTYGYLIALPILLILLGLGIGWRRRRR